MDETSLFVLAKDVEFIPVDDVTEKTRQGFHYDQGDVVVTYVNTRHSSKVISRDFSELLLEFQTPKSLATAIFEYSETHQKDPLQVADEVFEPLRTMRQWGFLIPYTNGNESLQQGILKSGEKFGNYTVLKKYHSYEDTEVYQVKDASGNLFALKLLIAVENTHVLAMFHNEIRVLQRLDGVVNPTLIEQGTENGVHFLVMEWCEGISCIKEAAKYWNINTRENVVKLMDLSIAILEAFYYLHQQGVIHGDIQQGNILISASGAVKIIDYGYAALTESAVAIQRGGTGFYYEPEYASAVINNVPRPPVTEKGEQYSIAVLLYQLVSSQDYLDFSFERERLFHQIMSDEPLPLKKFDLRFPEELDRIFKTALAKEPQKRYPSLNHFIDALQLVRNKIFADTGFFTINKENAEEQFIEFLIRKLGWDSPFIEQGLMMPPTSSVNYGAAGIAYMFYRMACVRQDSNLINLADSWANRASLYANDYYKSFYSASIDITEKTVGNRSLYHSPAGVWLTQALISHAKGDYHTLSKSLHNFLTAAKEPCYLIDLALGKSGILTGCALLCRELKTTEGYKTNNIETLADSLLKETWAEIDSYPSLPVVNPINYFGMAHGWAGILYATLLWCSTSGCELPGNFKNRLNQLLDCSIQEDNSLHWPLSVMEKNSWPGWCNGSAGHIFLWLLLYKHFNDHKFLQTAKRLANHLFSEIPGHSSNLCCGMAGQAYAMLKLYQATGENIYLKEVQRLKQIILKNISSPLLHNNSLYKGEVGLGVLFCESANSSLARMPLFE